MTFVYLKLAETPKDVVPGWIPGASWDRGAAAVPRCPPLRATYEAVMSRCRSAVS